MNDPGTPRPSPQAVHRALAHGAVVLHLESGQYHELNRLGTQIWSMLDGRRTVEDICRALRASDPAAPPRLEQDVGDFIGGLAARGLVVFG